MPREHRFDDRAQLAATLAAEITRSLERGVAERGVASLVVSGGSTPLPLFRDLREQPLDWDRVGITLADERWVAPDHADSNERLVRRELLRGDASRATFVPLKNSASSAEDGRDRCEEALAHLASPFDVVVLGMGGDGHTASLFPCSSELAAGLDLTRPERCLAVRPRTAPHPRMSLSLRALLDSRRLILHITGDEKWRVFQTAMEDGPREDLPIRAVLRNAPEMEVYWAP